MTSSSNATALPPSSAAVCSARSRSRSPSATRAPRRTSAVAVALPIPRAPPVIATTFPATDLTCLRAMDAPLELVEVPRDHGAPRASPQSRLASRPGSRRRSPAPARRGAAASRARGTRRGCGREPPSGPRPSIASGTSGATLLASLAPPREVGRDRPAEQDGGPLERTRRDLARVEPRPEAQRLGPQGDAVELVRDRADDRREARLRVGAHVDQQLAGRGDGVDRLPGADHRRDDAERLGPVRDRGAS